jgi:hypothetical protein
VGHFGLRYGLHYRLFTWELISLRNSLVYLGVFVFREYTIYLGLLKVRDGDGWRHNR